jgi:endonuclease/exonuclease/phosphatase family metal-dependent hydrolase
MVLATALAVLAPMQAEATTRISGVHVRVTHNSMTVTLKSLGSGWRYRLYTSTHKPDVYSSNLSNGRARHSALASRPKMAITKLGYTTRLYWYKILATKGTSKRYSPIYSVGLRPTVPSGVTATSSAGHGVALTWSNGAVTGLSIQRAADASFTTNVASYTLRNNSQQFSPPGLTDGSTYYFRVRALNNRTASAYSSVVSAVAQSNAQSVRVATYNLNTAAAGSPAEPWSNRRVAGAGLVKQAAPDLLAVQEASSWVSRSSHDAFTSSFSCSYYPSRVWRQVDDFVSALGGSYALAPTEYTPCNAPSGQSWFRGANYILYNPNTYSVVTAWHYVIDTVNGTQKWAAWAIMRNNATGAKLLFVGPHVTANVTDQQRETETNTLIQQATKTAADNGNLPIVYAGDYNSNSKHTLDGPGVAMRAAHNADAEYAAGSLTNFRYDSANKYLRTPPAFSDDIDHVFLSPGVAPRGWRLWLNLSNGQFVGTIPSDHNLLTADLDYPY